MPQTPEASQDPAPKEQVVLEAMGIESTDSLALLLYEMTDQAGSTTSLVKPEEGSDKVFVQIHTKDIPRQAYLDVLKMFGELDESNPNLKISIFGDDPSGQDNVSPSGKESLNLLIPDVRLSEFQSLFRASENSADYDEALESDRPELPDALQRLFDEDLTATDIAQDESSANTEKNPIDPESVMAVHSTDWHDPES